MPVGSETLICGQYTVTYAGSAMGIMEGDAGVPTIEYINHTEPINNTDKYGKTTIDDIYQGADAFCAFMAMEYKASTKAAWWPWGTFAQLGVIGRLGFNISSALVLTAIAGTPAAASPASITASKSLMASGNNTRLLYGPTLRKLPIRLRLYPFDSGGNVALWTET